MLVRLAKSQIEKRLKFIVPSVLAVINDTETTRDKIIEGLLDGTIQCWAYLKENSVIGILTTVIRLEPITRIPRLLVFSMVGFDVTIDSVKDSWKALEDFARENKCKSIVAYTTSKSVLGLFLKYGGKFEYFLSYELGGTNEDLQEGSLLNENTTSS